MSPGRRFAGATLGASVCMIIVLGQIADLLRRGGTAYVLVGLALVALLAWGALAWAEYHRIYDEREALLRKHRIEGPR